MSKSKPKKIPRRLIEVALPLIDINFASITEKKVKVGKPTSLHHWFAPRTLTVARAIIFAQMVSDPGGSRGYQKGKTKAQAAAEREKLFDVIRELIDWTKYDDPATLKKASDIIQADWQQVCELNGIEEELPAFFEPFCGRGTIPLEAQNLGLEVFASDLNPIPVTINKALLDYPKRYRGLGINRGRSARLKGVKHEGLSGLIQDIDYYGEKLLSSVKADGEWAYPRINNAGTMLPVVSWLWARTIQSPNPAFSGCHVPLVSNFVISAKAGKKVVLCPVVSGNSWSFNIEKREPTKEDKAGTVGRKGAKCILSGSPITLDYVRKEGLAGRIGKRLIAVVADSKQGRVYLPASNEHEEIANGVFPETFGIKDVPIEHWPGCTNSVVYGYKTFLSLFTPRQLYSLGLFCSHLTGMRKEICDEARASGIADAAGYSDAIMTYLAMAVSRIADWNNSFARWESKAQVPQQLFGRHTITMCWDYAESNPMHSSTGSFKASLRNVTRSLERNLVADFVRTASVRQHDAMEVATFINKPIVVSTDPPYYDNIPYSNLADFFYVWLRACLADVDKPLFATMATPKSTELVANKFRHKGKENAQRFFNEGMQKTVKALAQIASPYFPMTIYYAFKQKEDVDGVEVSTGWEMFLRSLVDANLQITGTWPLRTESEARMIASNKNALASSIVLVVRKRDIKESVSISRREFIRELNQVLPEALDDMTKGVGEDQSPIAPVDLSQAIIGPGMAVFSKYTSVLEADGSPMSVRTALQLINRFIAEDDFDADTQFCLQWFEQHGWSEESFGEADVLARAKSTSVGGLADAGVLKSGGGHVRLYRWSDYPRDWNPQIDTRIPVWEVLHQLIRSLQQDGESVAGRLLVQGNVQSRSEAARQLAYRLYTLCERKGWADDARAYNELITSWSAIESATPQTVQTELFE